MHGRPKRVQDARFPARRVEIELVADRITSYNVCYTKLLRLASLGQWPWTRYRVAHLLEKIRESGASSVGLDMVFAEPDRTSLELLSGEILRDLGVDIALAGIPPEARNSDEALAITLGAGPFVLGYQFDFDAARGESCVITSYSIHYTKLYE